MHIDTELGITVGGGRGIGDCGTTGIMEIRTAGFSVS